LPPLVEWTEKVIQTVATSGQQEHVKTSVPWTPYGDLTTFKFMGLKL
jgi:hypothetical protein